MLKAMLLVTLSMGLLIIFSVTFRRQEAYAALDKNAAATLRQIPMPAGDDPSSREYTLEIVGLGVSLDKFYQGEIWDALANGNAYSLIRDLNSKHHPWDGIDKMHQSAGSAGASIENAIIDTPRYWGTPVFNGEPMCLNDECRDRPELPQGGIVAGELMMRIPVLVHRELSERPDRIIEKIFAFFDQNPTVPYIVLGSADSAAVRANYSSPRALLKDGWYSPSVPDASAAFVLARRDRVDGLRPFVFKDLEEPQRDVDVLNRYGIARRVWLNYLALEKKVPVPPPTPPDTTNSGRTPTGEEWLASLELFSKQFSREESSKLNFKLTETLKMIDKPTLSPRWNPKPWFPVPWNTEQLEQFDRLPTLGYLHRPVFVKMVDADGKPLRHAADRQAALHQGWTAALETIPKPQRAAGPARVIVATGGKTSQLIDFHGMLRTVAENGGPKFDPNAPKKFIDTDRRLGNTGAATFFVQAAIGVLGSYREGGISAAVNLRDPDEASIIFVSPPSDEKRKEQHHPIGGDVLRSATIPAIDPRNYAEPPTQ